jgi:hypothetical protein
MKRIHVVSDNAISSQARTYAEYRVFAALSRYAQEFQRARIVLRPGRAERRCGTVTCAVTVTFDRSPAVRLRATGPHVYSAINRAVDRLAGVLENRDGQRSSLQDVLSIPGSYA